MNPLGDEYVPNYSDSEGQFFAAYNTDGILQFMHLFANGSTNNVRSVGLEIMEESTSCIWNNNRIPRYRCNR